MKKIKVDIDDIAMAMNEGDLLNQHYLDTKTGELIFISDYTDEVEGFDYEELEFGDRYEPVPKLKTFEKYNLRVEFAETRKNDKLHNTLLKALDGKGAFGRFRRVLDKSYDDLQDWYRFEEEFLKSKALEWLDEIGIEPILNKK